MTSKMAAPKMYLFIFNSENVVETLGGGFIPGTSVKINFF
jgi:hypothetical protein